MTGKPTRLGTESWLFEGKPIVSEDAAFLAMRQRLIDRGLLGADLRLTADGNAYVDALIAKLVREHPKSRNYRWTQCREAWETRTTNTARGQQNTEPGSAPSTANDGERQKVTPQFAGSMSLSSIGTRFGIGPTRSAPERANKRPGVSSKQSAMPNGGKCRASKPSTRSGLLSKRPARKSVGYNGRRGMRIRTAGELRGFLADVMVGIRNGSVEPTQAHAISKIAAQINQSIACEVNTALQLERMGKPGAVAGTMLIGGPPDENADDGTDDEPVRPPDMIPAEHSWCQHCEDCIPNRFVEGCGMRDCPAKTNLPTSLTAPITGE